LPQRIKAARELHIAKASEDTLSFVEVAWSRPKVTSIRRADIANHPIVLGAVMIGSQWLRNEEIIAEN
jgi:hypothetical protein